jgi:hypothetical protein
MTTDSTLHFYGDIQKVDPCGDGSVVISGIASTEATDADGEVVTADAMRKALPAYLANGTVREMHDKIAAGKPISAFVDDDGRTHFTARIVDPGTVAKIKAGVLKGFSIGGKALKKIGNKITELLLRDISVVDLPNNPDAWFSIIKFEKPEEKPMKKCKHCDEDMEKCGGKCSGAMAEKKKDERIEAIFSTVDTLVKGFESLQSKISAIPAAPAVPAELTKALSEIGDIKKRLEDATAATIETERTNLIQKMVAEGRIVYKEDGTANTPEDLKKMDLSVLKILAKNAQALPLVAKAVYKGIGTPPNEKTIPLGKDGKALTGAALTEAGLMVAGYDDLEKMIAAQSPK